MDRERVWQLVDEQREFLVATRRQLHQHPELSFKETATARLIANELAAMGYEPRTGLGSSGTGTTAVLEGGLPGPTIALRADIDGLPVDETNDLPFRSVSPGVMHACGHDAHTAILLGAARAMKSAQSEIAGRIVFLFQHAEEVLPGGAIDLIQAGCLNGVDAVFGLHQTTSLDVGNVAIAPGPLTASSDTFEIVVRGRGAHAALPHRSVDPIQIAAQLVTSLHQIVSRRIDPLDPAVITIGAFQAGTTGNVIPDDAQLTGTVRAFSDEARELLHREIEAVVRGVTNAWGATFQMEYVRGYPPLHNDAIMSELAARAAEKVIDRKHVTRSWAPRMAAEDFAHYLTHVPGAFAFLGTGETGVPLAERPVSHTASFAMDEAALPIGLAWYLSLATSFGALRGALDEAPDP